METRCRAVRRELAKTLRKIAVLPRAPRIAAQIEPPLHRRELRIVEEVATARHRQELQIAAQAGGHRMQAEGTEWATAVCPLLQPAAVGPLAAEVLAPPEQAVRVAPPVSKVVGGRQGVAVEVEGAGNALRWRQST